MGKHRARLPLDPAAVRAANKQLWSRYPELEGRQLTASSADGTYREFWIRAYEASGGQTDNKSSASPDSIVEECPQGKPQPNCGKSAAEYKLEAENRLAPAGSGVLDRNKAITKAYADMYASDPTAFKWCGMAAFASCEVGKGLKEAQNAQSGVTSVGGKVVGIDGKKMERALKAGNDAVFDDIYWQHLAYQSCGMADLEKAYHDGDLTDETIEAWRKIDAGNKTGSEALVWEGNQMLLKYEQREVLQSGVYDTDRKLWKKVSSAPVTWFEKYRIHSPIPGDKTTFDGFVDGGDIGNFDDRWRWIEQSMLPKWKELDKSPSDAINEMAPCLQ